MVTIEKLSYQILWIFELLTLTLSLEVTSPHVQSFTVSAAVGKRRLSEVISDRKPWINALHDCRDKGYQSLVWTPKAKDFLISIQKSLVFQRGYSNIEIWTGFIKYHYHWMENAKWFRQYNCADMDPDLYSIADVTSDEQQCVTATLKDGPTTITLQAKPCSESYPYICLTVEENNIKMDIRNGTRLDLSIFTPPLNVLVESSISTIDNCGVFCEGKRYCVAAVIINWECHWIKYAKEHTVDITVYGSVNNTVAVKYGDIVKITPEATTESISTTTPITNIGFPCQPAEPVVSSTLSLIVSESLSPLVEDSSSGLSLSVGDFTGTNSTLLDATGTIDSTSETDSDIIHETSFITTSYTTQVTFSDASKTLLESLSLVDSTISEESTTQVILSDTSKGLLESSSSIDSTLLEDSYSQYFVSDEATSSLGTLIPIMYTSTVSSKAELESSQAFSESSSFSDSTMLETSYSQHVTSNKDLTSYLSSETITVCETAGMLNTLDPFLMTSEFGDVSFVPSTFLLILDSESQSLTSYDLLTDVSNFDHTHSNIITEIQHIGTSIKSSQNPLISTSYSSEIKDSELTNMNTIEIHTSTSDSTNSFLSTIFPELDLISCMCPCNDSYEKNISLGTYTFDASKIAVNKTELSNYKRKFISASDNRISSRTIGYSGALILILTSGFLIFLDISTLLRDMRNVRKTFKLKSINQERKKSTGDTDA